ncbi:MAG: trypsin-like peptidase domain-containing protein, partial [Planctomycetes bacterium]|nr:trypsin-like peptidase domain-containing protein [Planctomycetota bacterium]
MKRNSQFSRLFVVLLVAVAVGSGWWSRSNRAETQSPRLKADVEIDGLQAAASMERALMKAIARAEASVVAIALVKRVKDQPRQPGNPFFPLGNRDRDDPSSPDFTPNAFGSGIIIAPLKESSQRFILTNYHVVKGGPAAGRKKGPLSEFRLYVRLANRGGYFAQIIAADPRSDLAVLSIDTEALGIKPSDLTPLRMSPADSYRKGQLVLALGNPDALA